MQMSSGAQKLTLLWLLQLYALVVPLCGLCGPFCCGGPKYCGHPGRQGWLLAWLVARSCLMWWLTALWWAVLCSGMVACGALSVPGLLQTYYWAGPGSFVVVGCSTWRVLGLVPACQQEGMPPVLIGQREDSKMALASTSVLLVKRASKNGCCPCFHPQGESQLPPTSPGGSPRLASWLTQALMKLLSLCWDSEHVRFCVCPLGAGSLFPIASWLS